jgi:hypothetical protein
MQLRVGIFFRDLYLVIPAQAGIQISAAQEAEAWVPAFAGMTSSGMLAE